jgi:glycine cleavage system regulatory protein
MAAAFALQRESIPEEICHLLLSIYVRIEKLKPEDVFAATFGTTFFHPTINFNLSNK